MTCLFVGRYHSHLQADLDAACHYFRQALAMKIDRAHTYRWLGYAELAAHRPAEAIVNWEKSQRLEPSLHGELEPRIARASAGVQLANRQDGETVTNFGS
jgi:tetratricopeptide (TPR) repeat protein